MSPESERAVALEPRFTRRQALSLVGTTVVGILAIVAGVTVHSRASEDDSNFYIKVSKEAQNPKATVESIEEMKVSYTRETFIRERLAFPGLTFGGGALVAIALGITLIKAM